MKNAARVRGRLDTGGSADKLGQTRAGAISQHDRTMLTIKVLLTVNFAVELATLVVMSR